MPFWKKPLFIVSAVGVLASVLAFFFITQMIAPSPAPTFKQPLDFTEPGDSIIPKTPPRLPVAANDTPSPNTSPLGNPTQADKNTPDTQAGNTVTPNTVKPIATAGSTVTTAPEPTTPELPLGQTTPGIKDQAFIVSSRDALNLRSTPRLPNIKNSNILRKLPPGSRVTIISDITFPRKSARLSGKWVKIKHLNQVGYVVDAYLQPAPEIKSGGRVTTHLQGKSFVIKEHNTQVFAEPFAGNPRTQLPAGTVVTAQDNILYPDKARGLSANWINVKGESWQGYILDTDAFPLNKTNAERKKFAPEATSIAVQGQLDHLGTKRYVLLALEGQRLRTEVLSSLPTTVKLFVYGADNKVLGFNATEVDGILPSTQDYYITLFGASSPQNPYHYKINIQ